MIRSCLRGIRIGRAAREPLALVGGEGRAAEGTIRIRIRERQALWL